MKNRVKIRNTELLKNQGKEETDIEIPTIDLPKNLSPVLFISMLLEPNNLESNVLKELLAIWLKFCQLNGKLCQIRRRFLLSRLLNNLYRLTTIKRNWKNRSRNKKDWRRLIKDKNCKRNWSKKIRRKERTQLFQLTTMCKNRLKKNKFLSSLKRK